MHTRLSIVACWAVRLVRERCPGAPGRARNEFTFALEVTRPGAVHGLHAGSPLKINQERRGLDVLLHSWAACCNLGGTPRQYAADLVIADLASERICRAAVG